jgi:DNA helicase HerA-like ATPase
MKSVINQGRHFGIEVIGVTQFPAQISTTFRANTAQLFIFALGSEEHQKAMLRLIGRDWKETLRALPNHSCIHMQNAQSRAYRQDRRGNLR